ncbi:MAG TPA: type I secretion system permease/ATPase [Magnetospirillum sp.]|nr:type I secretion system permease/ATPase [Magnetospirillum sp.]
MVRTALKRAAPLLGVVFLVSSVCNVSVILVSIYNMELYMRVLNTRNFRTLVALTAGLLIVMATHFILEYLRSALYQAAAARMLRRLALPTLLASSSGTRGGPADQPVRDLNELRGFISGPSLGVLLDMAWTPLFLGALFLMHWAYGAYGLVCALVIMGSSLASELLAHGKLHEANEATIRTLAQVAAVVRNPEPVEAMGMFPAVARRWRRSQAVMLELSHQGLRRCKTITASTKAFRYLVTGGMVALGLLMCLKGEVNAGSMLAGNLLVARLLLPFERVVASWRSLSSARAALGRVRAALAEPAVRRHSRAMPRPAGRLVVDRLAYLPRGADRPVLRGVSFTIDAGEMVGIVGRSAAGKSTLLRLMLGIAEPSSGGVYLDGTSTWLWEREDFARHVGFLPQRVALVEGTVAENIARLSDSPIEQIVAAARKAGVHDLIAALPHGYHTPVSELGYTLSGGQRQRIGLARALFGDPAVLVLDEPNASLDEDGETALMAAMVAAREAGATVLVVSHRPSVVAEANKLLLLNDGMVEAFDAPDRVMARLEAPATARALGAA